MENTRSWANDQDNREEYWRRVNESEGFDNEDILPPQDASCALMTNYPHTHRFAYPVIVDLYAKLGLHRYNLLEGTQLQFLRIIKYSYLTSNLLKPYYITMLVVDPVTGVELTFQVRIEENEANALNLAVPIARPKDNSTRTLTSFSSVTAVQPLNTVPHFELPEWPSRFAFNDCKRFALFSEQSTLPDWISLYLELLLCSTYHIDFDSSELRIVQTAIESISEDIEPLDAAKNAKDVMVYITFKGVRFSDISEHHLRKCIVRRSFDHLGCLILQGAFSGEDSSSSSEMSPQEISKFLDRISRRYVS